MKREMSLIHGESSDRTRIKISRKIAGVWLFNEYIATEASIKRVRNAFFLSFCLDPQAWVAAADNVLEIGMSVPKSD